MSVEAEMGFTNPGGRRARGFVGMFVEVEMGFAGPREWYDRFHELAGTYINKDELLISTSNRKRPGRPKNKVWQHFNTIPADSTNGKKDLHSGAACKFCKQK
ncbi:hypothetical protein Glove_526g50 [Diversispora epigaea]|uniref:BED-type domain-containing protein n=1 Tax=Diversispora epigaea TaxID=1348612 RepID=A0A397GE15_9GLOM|nr:hypothetical protein Glove_526g50 [Diversispora epigaea]